MGGRMLAALNPGGELQFLKYGSPIPGVSLNMPNVCPKGELDDSKYGSPMPMVGLYIAFATLVSCLCMAFDMGRSLQPRRKETWFPCKFFSINSFTLTLVSIATKLSVDLSTKMPTASEQLSKLTSSGFLCIVMAFFMPSIPSSNKYESLANVASLGMLVITVFVNLCMEISTGAIYAFMLEHVILMICMLLLLGLLCSATAEVNYICHADPGGSKYSEVAKETKSVSGLEGMKQQLNNLVTCRYNWDSQLICCETSNCSCVGLLCVLVLGVVLEAAFRSLAIKEIGFCNGVSDYKWSIRWVVVSHILAIIMGFIVVCSRWLIVVCHRSIKFKILKNFVRIEAECGLNILVKACAGPTGCIVAIGYINAKLLKLVPLRSLLLGKVLLVPLLMFLLMSIELVPVLLLISMLVLLVLLNLGIFMASELVVLLCSMGRKLISLEICIDRYTNRGENEKIDKRCRSYWEDGELDKWISRSAAKKLKRLMEQCKKLAGEKFHLPNLVALLSKTFPPTSQQRESLFKVIQRREEDDPEFHPSPRTLLRVLLVMKTHCVSNAPLDFKVHDEAMYLVDFLEDKMKWDWRDNTYFTIDRVIASGYKAGPTNTVEDAFSNIEKFRGFDFDKKSIYKICQSILEREYASVTQLSEEIEQAILDALIPCLAKLPIAIFKDYSEVPFVECLGWNWKRAIRFMCILESLDKQVPEHRIMWEWPNEQNVNERDILTSTANPTVAAAASDNHIVGTLPPDDRIQQAVSETM